MCDRSISIFKSFLIRSSTSRTARKTQRAPSIQWAFLLVIRRTIEHRTMLIARTLQCHEIWAKHLQLKATKRPHSDTAFFIEKIIFIILVRFLVSIVVRMIHFHIAWYNRRAIQPFSPTTSAARQVQVQTITMSTELTTKMTCRLYALLNEIFRRIYVWREIATIFAWAGDIDN